MSRRFTRPVLAVAAAAAVLTLGACSHTPAVTAPAGTPSAAPTGVADGTVQQMQEKVDAAQSAADAADSDAATDPNE
jgi:delta-aminolevulinic acid dehydratase/porphobilinogen synthase